MSVDNAKEDIFAKFDHAGMLFSIDKTVDLVEAGKVNDIGNGVKKLLDHITVAHPYHP